MSAEDKGPGSVWVQIPIGLDFRGFISRGIHGSLTSRILLGWEKGMRIEWVECRKNSFTVNSRNFSLSLNTTLLTQIPILDWWIIYRSAPFDVKGYLLQTVVCSEISPQTYSNVIPFPGLLFLCLRGSSGLMIPIVANDEKSINLSHASSSPDSIFNSWSPYLNDIFHGNVISLLLTN